MILLLLLLVQIQKPLPDLDRFLQATKTELVGQIDQHEVLEGYTYHRKTIYERLSADGKIKNSEVTQDEIVRGVPLKHKHRDPIFVSRSKSDNAAMIEDMFGVWDFLILRRENIDGRPAIAIAFAPKKRARPQTDAGRWLFKNAKGVVWVDEADHRIVRVHAVLVNDISVAWGMLARAHKGSEMFREWKKVNDEVWLPSWSRVHLLARAFIVGFNFEEVEEYSDYRKAYAVTNPCYDSPR